MTNLLPHHRSDQTGYYKPTISTNRQLRLKPKAAWCCPGGRSGRSPRPGLSLVHPPPPPLGRRGLSRHPLREYLPLEHSWATPVKAAYTRSPKMADDNTTQTCLKLSNWEADFQQRFNTMCQRHWSEWENQRKPPTMPAPMAQTPERATARCLTPERKTQKVRRTTRSPRSRLRHHRQRLRNLLHEISEGGSWR
ncbi:Hypothetical predicted protein [Pelobates cultripes]|uniref:Uncharacterized protein n=1 Tax=Pelobates cultripes TaxID=61616 RepID=A0AAD1VZT3_PELCU|nr:Hypothetical predicted protein [Pelobates cultripes]